MNVFRFKRALTLSVLFLIPILAMPQVTVERSTEKIIISGKQYYFHHIKKGETLYSISHAYNVSIEELTSVNPKTVYGIKDGDILIIPVVAEQPVVSKFKKPKHFADKDETKYYYHILQSGETIYALSKRYGISESEIINANQGIDITDISIGSEIAVPKRDMHIARQQFAVQDSTYIFHKVERGETFYSIAGKYKMPVKELRRQNKNIRFPSAGDFVRIPYKYASNNRKVERENVGETNVTDSITIFEQPVRREYTPVKRLNGVVNVAVLLPFFLKENSVRVEIDSSRYVNGKRIYRQIKRPEEWILSRSQGFVEMYEGILVAADTLRKLGLDINLHVFDITNNTRVLEDLIRKGRLDDMDLIIGPVYSSCLAIASKYASLRNIPIVSPVQLLNNQLVNSNRTLFTATPSLRAAQDKMAEYVADYYNDNIIFLHTDTAGRDNDVKYLKNKIISELSCRMPYEELKFKEFFFYNRSAFNNDSINRLSHAVSKYSENLIIIASESAPVISESLQEIYTLLKYNKIRVLCYPIIRGMDNVAPQYLFDNNLMVYSPFWIDYSQADVKKFLASFYSMFLTEPPEMSYAWTGYDIAYYFISGIAMNGKRFLNHPNDHNPDLLQTQFNFRKVGLFGGYENNHLFPIRYTKSNDIVLENTDKNYAVENDR